MIRVIPNMSRRLEFFDSLIQEWIQRPTFL